MPEQIAITQEVHATLAPASWDEAYFSLLSLKHALGGVPGWKRMDILASNQDDDTIHLRVLTTWAGVEQMEAWLDSDLTVEGVLKGMTPPPVQMTVSFYEKIS